MTIPKTPKFTQMVRWCCMVLALFAPGQFAFSQKKPRDGKKAKESIEARASDGTGFSLRGDRLTVRRNGETLHIDKVYRSFPPREEVPIVSLYNPVSKMLVVPMADSTYRVYGLAQRVANPDLTFLLDGGRSIAFGKWAKDRNYWAFTGWKDEHTLTLEIYPLLEPSHGTTLTVDIEKWKIHGKDPKAFRLRRHASDNSDEEDLEYVVVP